MYTFNLSKIIRRWHSVAAVLAFSFVSTVHGQVPCVPYTPGIPQLYSLDYVSDANSDGDRLVVGDMSISTYFTFLQYLPAPASENQEFCGLVNIAPGVLARVYIPTFLERFGVYSSFSAALIDPLTNLPFPGGIIPMSRLGFPFAFRIAGNPVYHQPNFAVINAGSGKALDVKGLSTRDGGSLQQWDYWSGANQQWQVALSGKDTEVEKMKTEDSRLPSDHYGMANALSGLNIDVKNESSNNGAAIQQWTNLDGDNQQWEFDQVDSIHFKILNRLSGMVLDVRGRSTSNGAPVQQWEWVGGDNQKWQFVPQVAYKIVNSASNKALDVKNSSSNNGAPVQQWDYVGGANQQWRLVAADDQTFFIQNVSSQKVLDVKGMSGQNAAAIQQWQYLGGDNQKWQLLSADGVNYEIVNKLSGRALDVRGSSMLNGAGIQQWDYLQGLNQQWQIIPLVESDF